MARLVRWMSRVVFSVAQYKYSVKSLFKNTCLERHTSTTQKLTPCYTLFPEILLTRRYEDIRSFGRGAVHARRLVAGLWGKRASTEYKGLVALRFLTSG